MTGAGGRIATVAVFTLVAPPLAGVLGTLAMLWEAILVMPEVAFMALSGVLFGYVVGVPPALLSGLFGAWISPRLGNGWIWTGACALMAGVLSAALSPLIQFGGGRLSPFGQVSLPAGSGAAAALVCALICFSFRPRPGQGPYAIVPAALPGLLPQGEKGRRCHSIESGP